MHMAYEYRNLSSEERQEVLRQRCEAGYPLHAPPHPFRNAGYYFITAANYEHVHIMGTPERRTEFEGRLSLAMQAIQVELVAWVILTNHYHFLVGVETLDQVSVALRQLHGSISSEWNKADSLSGQRRVWYKFRDCFIRNDRHFYSALNYIHVNPIKHGYVKNPYDWPWMSLQNYYDTQGRDWLREIWEKYPPGNFGEDS